jgi:hypothetical protein
MPLYNSPPIDIVRRRVDLQFDMGDAVRWIPAEPEVEIFASFEFRVGNDA